MTKLTTCNDVMCLHQEEGACTQREVSLNSEGHCLQRMHIVVDDKLIEEKKQKFWEIVERGND